LIKQITDCPRQHTGYETMEKKRAPVHRDIRKKDLAF